MNFQKIDHKNVSYFSRKCEEPSKIIVVLRWPQQGINNSQKRYFYHSGTSSFDIRKKIFLSFKNKEILQFKVTKGFFSNPKVKRRFSPEDIWCEKTSAIQNCKKCNNNLKFMIRGLQAFDRGVTIIFEEIEDFHKQLIQYYKQ